MKPNVKFTELRKRLGPSQSEFANKIGVSRSTIADIERGRIRVSKRVRSKIVEKFNVEIGYFDTEKSVNNVEIKQGVEIGSRQGFEHFFERDVDPFAPYLELTDKELDHEIKLEIDDFKSIYQDYKKLLEAIYHLDPPAFFKKKFGVWPEFDEYLKSIESEHEPVFDQNDKENSFTKVDKIVNLYKKEQEHMHYRLSLLIDYFNRYSDFFLDEKEIKDSLTD